MQDASSQLRDGQAYSRRDAGHEENLVTAVWLDWHALQACAERGEGEVLRNREAVLGAVRVSEGEAFQFAALELRSDPEFVLEVMQTNGLAMQFAAPEVKANRAFVLQAVKLDGRALKYVAPKLRADREVVIAAIRQHGPALAYASDDLLSDFTLLLEATEKEVRFNSEEDAKRVHTREAHKAGPLLVNLRK